MGVFGWWGKVRELGCVERLGWVRGLKRGFH